MKSVILKSVPIFLIFFLFLSCQSKDKEVSANKNDQKPKYIKMDKDKNTLEECISELKRRIAMEPEFEKDVKFEEKKRYSVLLGSTKMIDAKIEFLSDVSDEERKILTSQLAYNYIYSSIEWSYFFRGNVKTIEKPEDFTFELYDGIYEKVRKRKYNFKNEIILHFLSLLQGRKYDKILVKINFYFNEDIVQAFEVALNRGFKDIADCILERTESKRDRSRMLIPLIQYFGRLDYNDRTDLYYSLMGRKVDSDKPFPCIERRNVSGIYNHFCYPLIESLKSKDYPLSFAEDYINENSSEIKGARGDNAIILLNEVENDADNGYRFESIEKIKNIFAKNGIKNWDMFFDQKDVDISKNSWYTGPLMAMEEKSLLKRKDADFIFRFTYIPTFTKPVVVCIEKEKEKYVMISKRAYGKGGYDPGELEITEKRELKKEEIDKILKMIKESNFWKLDFKLKRELAMLDGAQWVFEGVNKGDYNAVERISIDSDDDSVKKIGIYLLEISGIRGFKKKTK